MEINKVNKYVGNLMNDNIKKLENIFPSVVKDGEVDFEELKELLGDFKEVDKEKYEMNWVGKQEAKKIALSPIYGKTLKYIEGDGKNENTTENLYIEGDNLEVLKLLQNAYYGKIKMIYIDPPYNTGKDFIYSDKFNESKKIIDISQGYETEYGERLVKNKKDSSNYHSKWLSMMYSRLLVAKELLRSDGIIYISIDDYEIHNLRKICDEVFGSHNLVSQFVWRRTDNQSNIGNIAKVKEYILCYAKDKSYDNFKLNKMTLSEKAKKEYSYEDSIGKFRRKNILDKSRGKKFYEIKSPNGEVLNGPWIIDKEEFEKLKINDKIYWANGKMPYGKKYLKEAEGQIISDWLDRQYGTNQRASDEINELFNMRAFDFSKPISLIKTFIQISTDHNDIILDFFSGSSTTAHAVIESNLTNYKNCKYIMIQIPEDIDKNSDVYKAGYKNICEIGKERIRRAGDKIIEEIKDSKQIDDLDIGFKVFRVEDSNIKWQNQINEYNQFKYNLDGVDIDDIDFMPNSKDIDIVYEILLRHYGIALTAKIDKLDFIGNRTYTIEDSIIVCLETEITKEIIDEISKLEPVKVIFRDSAFGEDISLKQNSIHRLNVLIEKNNKNTTHTVEFI